MFNIKKVQALVLNGCRHAYIEIDGMSFNLSDLYNASFYRNLKLQINKIRFALQDQRRRLSYTLTMYLSVLLRKFKRFFKRWLLRATLEF